MLPVTRRGKKALHSRAAEDLRQLAGTAAGRDAELRGEKGKESGKLKHESTGAQRLSSTGQKPFFERFGQQYIRRINPLSV